MRSIGRSGASSKLVVAVLCVLGVLVLGSPTASAATTSVTGRVTLPGDVPAAGFEVTVGVLTDESEFWDETVTTDVDGVYSISDIPSGITILWVTDPDPGSTWVETYYGNVSQMGYTEWIEPGVAHTDMDIQMILGGTITGTVTEFGGAPAAGEVELDFRGVPLEADGSYVLGGVEEGPVLVTFRRDIAGSDWQAIEYGFADVVAGETVELDFEFPEHASPIQPADPSRLVDTRTGRPQGAVPVTKGRIGGNRTVAVDLSMASIALPSLWELGGPLAGVSLNVTATGATGGGYVTVYPCGTPRPTVSSVNFEKGQTVANAVVAPLDGSFDGLGGHQVCLYSSAPVDVVVDINGWIPSGVGIESVTPARVVDTRKGKPQGTRSVTKEQVGPSEVVRVDLTGTAGIPADDVAAASLNLTVTGAQGPGYVTAYACDSVASPRPPSSSVNFAKGVVANAAITPVAADGGVCLYSSAPVDVIIDANGWISTDSGFTSVAGTRLADTRPGKAPASTPKERINKGRVLTVDTGTTALAANLNVTVVGPSSAGFVTVYPCDQTRPDSSNLNFTAGQTVANMVLSPLSFEGTVCVYSSASADVVVDLNGTVDGSYVGFGGWG